MPYPLPASPNTGTVTVAVTPHDTTKQPVPFRALYLGVGGNVSITFYDGTSFTFLNAPAGFFPHGGVRVNATDTTATNIGAVYG